MGSKRYFLSLFLVVVMSSVFADVSISERTRDAQKLYAQCLYISSLGITQGISDDKSLMSPALDDARVRRLIVETAISYCSTERESLRKSLKRDFVPYVDQALEKADQHIVGSISVKLSGIVQAYNSE